MADRDSFPGCRADRYFLFGLDRVGCESTYTLTEPPVEADIEQWGVLYSQIGGLPYVFGTVYGFSITQVGLVYLTLWFAVFHTIGVGIDRYSIGSFLAFFGNFIQDAIYRYVIFHRVRKS